MAQYTRSEDIVFIDTEVNPSDNRVEDIGAVRTQLPVLSADGMQFHSASLGEFEQFIKNTTYICGHNIIKFDLKYIFSVIESAGAKSVIDTLYLSPLLFPYKPYHKLLKDDKIQADDLNSPLNDARKAMELFMDEVSAFGSLDISMKKIYCTLLEMKPQFRGFFRYVNFHEKVPDIAAYICQKFQNRLCKNTDIATLAAQSPAELSYCLAVISTGDRESLIPYWVQKNYPKVHDVYRLLRGTPCSAGCEYCKSAFNIHAQLKKKFGYDEFRCYDGEPLQEKAVKAAVNNKSLLAVFPTGGGKSITFQLPALIAAETTQGLTVVISPLQSLMKDQVDNLAQKGITDAVTVNGLLNVVERAEALERVENGIASILYISPESLRSKTIERLLLGRNIARFVIDEAHCFSSWGQEFRVDYLYIGDFIAQLQENKGTVIPVSCFTATAKQKVISDIKEYFKQKLNLELELYTTYATRTNLRYEVLYRKNDIEKYNTLRILIEQKNCPAIVYASRTKKTVELADKLYKDGFNARAFHGKMASDEKIANQEAFIRGEVQIIVATSAFGMGVDKKDVKLVVHYDISDSLENYVQEAGRAGRDENIHAECYILFNENDLDKHFILLNQTKLSISEIQRAWKGIKELTRTRKRISCSALEIARQAGWDETMQDVETKVKTAVMALETSGYVKRGQNCPRVYADSIQVKTAQEAIARIRQSDKFNEKQREYAVRIIRKLISTRSRAAADSAEAESRVDYIADHLGISKEAVIESVSLMREEGILANERELSVYVDTGNLRAHSKRSALNRFAELEGFFIDKIKENGTRITYKMINEEALNKGITFSSVNSLRILVYFWVIKGYIRKPQGEISVSLLLEPQENLEKLKSRFERRIALARFIENYFLERAGEQELQNKKETLTVPFSIRELQRAYDNEPKLFPQENVSLHEVEEALLYLSKINAFRLEGGFFVLYNAMEITRVELDNKKRYKVEDYRQLKEFYHNKTQQIHIVGEYANMMVRDYEAALMFVNDYFRMEYRLFLTKYFKGARLSEIERNITPVKYRMLFENLTKQQADIINDDSSKEIVVAAGPGSGKTMILVHKLASLMLLEDVKHEQLLMLTFSRAAAIEFKKRLVELIGNAAHFVEIKTFHSYCFDLLGKVGSLESSQNVVRDAAKMILEGDVELDRITKTVLVLDEAQDMDEDEFALVTALMDRNEDLRVIAVGDDDQNIYEFRGSDSKYMASLLNLPDARKYELLENFRSSRSVIDISNAFVRFLPDRMKNNEIRPVESEQGGVVLTKVRYSLEMAVVSCVEKTQQEGLGRTAAVLTVTNEQAYLVTELLNKKGYRARLLQSNDGFLLYDLAEMRFVLSCLGQTALPVITEQMWNDAMEQLKTAYSRSDKLDSCLYLLEQFTDSNPKKYFTDLESFLREVRFEDFYCADKDEISVSTIHKAKGREFDDVYMLLSGRGRLDDAQRRCVYVGMTRAKSHLYICHNTEYFEAMRGGLETTGILFQEDGTPYPQPEEIILPLTHRDVKLWYFKNRERERLIDSLRSGDELLFIEENYQGNRRLYFGIRRNGAEYKIACCSDKFFEKLSGQREKGYALCSANVSYVVKWRDKDSGLEYSIVLPVIRLRKQH